MTQLGGSSSAFEPLLLAQRFLVCQEPRQPFRVFEAARFGLGIEVLEAFWPYRRNRGYAAGRGWDG